MEWVNSKKLEFTCERLISKERRGIGHGERKVLLRLSPGKREFFFLHLKYATYIKSML